MINADLKKTPKKKGINKQKKTNNQPDKKQTFKISQNKQG